MGKPIAEDGNRASSFWGILQTNTDLGKAPAAYVDWAFRNPKEAGEELTRFFANSGKFTILGPGTLIIDRSKAFDPAKFIGSGWTIWKGPRDGYGLKGEEAQDKRSLAMTEFNLVKAILQTGLEEGETSITGEVKLARLLQQATQADARVAQALFEEEGQTTLRWMHKHLGVTWMEFLGTELRRSDGHRYALYLYRNGDGSWDWRYRWLDNGRDAGDRALGFAK
jgi:hypothetical protein